jgi:hypothetical protein
MRVSTDLMATNPLVAKTTHAAHPASGSGDRLPER